MKDGSETVRAKAAEAAEPKPAADSAALAPADPATPVGAATVDAADQAAMTLIELTAVADRLVILRQHVASVRSALNSGGNGAHAIPWVNNNLHAIEKELGEISVKFRSLLDGDR
jgi:hypothetical protein